MRNLIYEWVDDYIRPRRWMACVYYCAERNRLLFVAFPLNLLVTAFWWAQDKWAEKANAPSWIEREIEARIARRDSTIRRR